MKKRNITTKEILEILSNPWCTFRDLSKITNYGDNKTAQLKKEIMNKMKSEGYYIFNERILPMDYVIKYLNINIKGLKEIASINTPNKK